MKMKAQERPARLFGVNPQGHGGGISHLYAITPLQIASSKTYYLRFPVVYCRRSYSLDMGVR